MVKNLPTIERSTKIRFGKYATEDQGENTVVFNASNVAIDTSGSGSIYMTPLRVTNPASTTVIGYNPTTKELYNTNVLTSDIGNGGGGDITLGTGTTGDYVSTITGGNGITTTGATSGETIAHTLSIDTKSNGGLVIESNKLAVNLGASSITGTLAVGDGGTGATTLDNLITLGSHTTGNYVQSITGGNGITAGAASEGGTPTVAIDAKTNGGLVIESNQLAVDLGASSITGTLAVGDGGTNITNYGTGEILYSSTGSLTKLPIGTAGEVLTVDGTGIPSWAAASAPSPWTTSSSDIYYNSGNVGIGTATPSSNLEVKVSSASSASNPIAKFTAATSSGGNDAYTQIEGYEDSALNFYGHYFGDGFTIGCQQNFNPGAGFTISHGNTLQSNPRFFINLSGNVGIGTTNPGSKLDVSGTVTASSFSGSGSGLTSMSASNISSGTLAVGRGGTNISSYSTGDIIYATGSTSLTTLGIGLTGEVLTVDGTGIPSWAAASGGGFTGDIAEYITHTSDSDTKFGFPQNDTFTITTANGERFRIDSNGDV